MITLRRPRIAIRFVTLAAPGIDPRWFALCLTTGVLGVHTLATLPTLSTCLGLAIPALLPWRGRALWSGLALGALLAVWSGQQWLAQRWPEARQGEERSVVGRIASLPEQDGIAQHFLFEPDPDRAENQGLPTRIRAGWYRAETRPRGGECWRLQLRLRAPRGSANPGGFDYEAWLYRQNIGASATVRDGERCAPGPSEWSLPAIRESIRDHYRRWLPDDPGRGLVEALTVGDVSELHDRDWNLFRLTGTSHLVAVSGFNVAIVAAVVYLPLRWLWVLIPGLCLWLPAQRAAAFGAAATATVYAAIAGLEAPVARATAMVLLALLAALLARRASMSRLLALAWIGVLISSPAAVLSPGVWLSFGAVAGIVWVTAGRLGPIPQWRQGLAVQAMLSMALAPLSLYFFSGLSWIAPVVNLPAVPLIAVLTPVLVGASLLAWIWPTVGITVLGVSAEVIWRLRNGLEWLAEQVPNPWLAAAPTPGALLLAGIGALLIFMPRGVPSRLLGLTLILPLLIPPTPAVRQGFRLTTLDVGQGLAVVIETAHHALVFDTGPAYDEGFDAGSSIVAPYLLNQGIRTLDLLIVSHADLDHRGGAPAVRRLLSPTHEFGALSDQACVDGQHWEWDGVVFTMLHPSADSMPPISGAKRNNNGCVLRVAAGTHAALLPADIEAPAERRLVKDHADLLPATVLIAPHHGSKSSSTTEFVQTVNPDYVIFAAAFGNSYHFPNPIIASRYLELGTQLEQTGLSGAISVEITAELGIGKPKRWRKLGSHFWNAPELPGDLLAESEVN